MRKHNKGKLKVEKSMWYLVKLALQSIEVLANLQQYVSQIHNEDATKHVMKDLPDFAALDLCPPTHLITMLGSSPDILLVESVLPSSPSVDTSKLNLFKVAGYFSKLAEQCSWNTSSLSVSNSNWHLHHHVLTPCVYPKAKALLSFLMTQSKSFSKISRLPSPPVGIFTHPTSKSSQPVIPSAATIESYLTASEAELTTVWTSPLQLPHSRTDGITEKHITGYFAMNTKAVRAQNVDSSTSLGLNVHIVHTLVNDLEELYKVWNELAASMKVYIDSKASSRPVSRSLTKQKKVDKSMKVPQELVESLNSAIDQLRVTFGAKFKEVSECSGSLFTCTLHTHYKILGLKCQLFCPYTYSHLKLACPV